MEAYNPTKAIFDHVALYCPADIFEEELRVYNAALAPLGIKEQMRIMPLVAALGDNPTKQEFWLSAVNKDGPITGPVSNVHIAFKATDRAQVDEFHRAGVAAGGKDNGLPGIRSMYHPGYYAAFVITPSGTNVEVVFHDVALLKKE